MSEITGILEKLKGTKEAEILEKIEASYEKIAAAQKTWYEKSSVLCPSGCGQCCHNFEPDLLSSEALYMAAWLLENQAGCPHFNAMRKRAAEHPSEVVGADIRKLYSWNNEEDKFINN